MAAPLGLAPRLTGSKDLLATLHYGAKKLVPPTGLAPVTLGLKDRYSDYLSYGGMVLTVGVAPTLSRLSTWCLCYWATRAGMSR